MMFLASGKPSTKQSLEGGGSKESSYRQLQASNSHDIIKEEQGNLSHRSSKHQMLIVSNRMSQNVTLEPKLESKEITLHTLYLDN